jgi:hypothetical protein
MVTKQLVLNGDNANNPEAVGLNPTPAVAYQPCEGHEAHEN